MSIKRQATTELNHENWDQDDPSEHEEMGAFKVAPKDVLERRVMRTAKRRTHATAPASSEAKQGVFSGFGGFKKAAPSSFDFLANLTNGNKTDNSSSNKQGPTGLFGSSPVSGVPGGGFSIPLSTTPATNTTFGSPNLVFGKPANEVSNTETAKIETPFKTSGGTPFKMSSETPFKISSETPFKMTSPSSNNTELTGNTPKSSLFPESSVKAPMSSIFTSTKEGTDSSPFKIPAQINNDKKDSDKIPSNVFGASATNSQQSKSLFTNTSTKTDESSDKKDDKKLTYYANIKALNESVLDWIKQCVEESPICILSPIFRDYEKHLKKLQDEYDVDGKSNDSASKKEEQKTSAETKKNTENKQLSPSSNNKELFGVTQKSSMFSTTSNSEKPATTFSFGITSQAQTMASNTATSSPAKGFIFGSNSTPTSTPASASFSIGNTTNPSNSSFSFGTGKPFSFNSSIEKPADADNTKTTEENEDDEPPKVEYTPVVEENSVFDKKCKIFVKKDGNFVDNGVGTLYIKKIEESGKHQLLVRANTNLGNILLNLVLSSSIPTQRMGKNNVMLVCIPTPDAKPPPTPILIRVKTSEEADELLETLNKYKA